MVSEVLDVPTAQPGRRTPTPRARLWRVRDRERLRALRQQGRRGRAGALSVRWLPPSDASGAITTNEPPAVAFAVGRRVGTAVVRNRVRRRLAAALRVLHGEGRLPDGAYLVSGGPEVTAQPWPALVDDVAAAVQRATGAVPTRSGDDAT